MYPFPYFKGKACAVKCRSNVYPHSLSSLSSPIKIPTKQMPGISHNTNQSCAVHVLTRTLCFGECSYDRTLVPVILDNGTGSADDNKKPHNSPIPSKAVSIANQQIPLRFDFLGFSTSDPELADQLGNVTLFVLAEVLFVPMSAS